MLFKLPNVLILGLKTYFDICDLWFGLIFGFNITIELNSCFHRILSHQLLGHFITFVCSIPCISVPNKPKAQIKLSQQPVKAVMTIDMQNPIWR